MGVLNARVGGAWVPVTQGGLLVPGGIPNQVLVKQSTTDGDALWQSMPMSGLEANKPTPPGTTPVLQYWATDTKRLWLWDGTGWIIMAEPPQSFTVNPRQNNIAVTNTAASAPVYQRSGGWVEVYSSTSITGAGTAGTPFSCVPTGLPTPFSGAAAAAGVFNYYDTGTGSYVGTVTFDGTTVSFAPHLSNWTLGGNPNFAAANGDGISFSMRYRMASRYT